MTEPNGMARVIATASALLLSAGLALGQLAGARGGDAALGGDGARALTEQESAPIVAARARLRADFFNATNHALLAKAYHDAHADIMAFRILRYAQTRYFSPAEFFDAFYNVFHGRPAVAPVTPEQALAAARAAAELAPLDAKAQLAYGRCIAKMADRAEEATQQLEKACHLDGDSGAALAALATVLATNGQRETARTRLAEFVARRPADADAVVQLAELWREEAPARARTILRAGLATKGMAPAAEAKLHLALGYMTATIDSGNPEESEKTEEAQNAVDVALAEFQRAAELDPDNPVILTWWASTTLLMKKDLKRALELYLEAWFLDPMVRDRTWVYERITGIIEDQAARALATVANREQALSAFDHWNAQVALGSWAMAFQQEGVARDFIDVAFSHLAHDDEQVRFQAARYIAERCPKNGDQRIQALLNHADVMVRGTALYIAIVRWGENSRPTLRLALKSENDYLRFEAYAALKQLGGDWGKALMQEYLPDEPVEKLRLLFKD